MSHHFEALGWTLVHFCWQATAITLVYWVADTVLSKARGQTRYLLALVSMLLMLIAAVATFSYEEMQGHSDISFSSSMNAMQKSSISIDLTPLPAVGSSNALKQPVQLQLAAVLPWLDVAWLLGVACFSVRTIGGWWLVQRLRKKALVEAPEAVRASFVRMCKRLGIVRHVELRLSEHIQGPLAIGVMRALILLPVSALTALSPEQLEVVLAHELAHVRRADYLWNLLQTMVETLFFFHPAVWWVGSKVRQQRELCCDDIAIASCSDPLIYATALLRLEEQRSRQLNLAMALDGHQSWSGLRARIARVLGEAPLKRNGRELAPLPLAAIGAALLLLLLPLPQVFAGLRAKPARMKAQIVAPIAPITPVVPELSALDLPAPVAPPVTLAAPVALKTSLVAPVSPSVSIEANDDVAVVIASGRGEGTGQGAGEGAGFSTEQQEAAADSSPHKGNYIDRMKAAGYDVDLDKYIAMKVQDITPEYARDMAKAGFGKPSADDLIAMKVQGITPEYVSQLRASGIEPASIGDLISYRIFQVSPEFIAGMKAAGFNSIPAKKLIELRVHGVTPEYARTVKHQYPDATLEDIVQLRIFHIDDAFIASAKQHGFTQLSIKKLVQLRISGVLDDEGLKQ